MNPWHKRANEFIRDPRELLPLISPQPIRDIFDKQNSSALFDRLVLVAGTPGAGKTTLSRLLELPTLLAVKDSGRNEAIKAIAATLSAAGVLDDMDPTLIALRFPVGSQLRSIWELPYEEKIRHKLLRSMIQAKAVLGWLRQLEAADIPLENIQVHTTGIGDAASEQVGAESIASFRERARDTERTIFKLVSALVAPTEAYLETELAQMSYDPFSMLDFFAVDGLRHGATIRLRPMIMLDDAHEFHPSQLDDVDKWLRDREVKVARWLMTRLDSLSLTEYRKAVHRDTNSIPPGTQPDRDRIEIILNDQKSRERVAFRSIAEDVAKRYFEPIPAFNRRASNDFKVLLAVNTPPEISKTDLKKLESEVAKLREEAQVTHDDIGHLQAGFPPSLGTDVTSALTRIILHREMSRSPQRSLFSVDDKEKEAEESNAPKKVSRAVATGAELHLLHQFERPFYFSFERIADAANANIEQFVSLSSALVDHLETLIIRGKPPRIDAKTQNHLVQERARTLMKAWDFPYAPKVRRLVDYIAGRCLDVTLRPNAPLDDGANAFGIPIADMESLQDPNDDLTIVLHYALAYQALVLIDHYPP